MKAIPKKMIGWLKRVSLQSGQHRSAEDGVCALEAVAYVAGESHSDHPSCVCPVIGQFMRSWNDSLSSDEERNKILKPLLFKIIGTKSTPDIEHRRSLMALDWLIRTNAAAWLDLTDSLKPYAKALSESPEVNEENAEAIGHKVKAAWSAAESAARSAAWSAARSAAESAARSAAESAAESAAWSAAESAAESAAWSAARSAAWSAARSAAESAALRVLEPTVKKLQKSAIELVERMIEVGS